MHQLSMPLPPPGARANEVDLVAAEWRQYSQNGEDGVLAAVSLEEESRELEEAKRAIQEQKLIGRAKLVVMEQFGLSENNAYRRLQKQAMSENTTIAAIAAKIVNITTKTTAQR